MANCLPFGSSDLALLVEEADDVCLTGIKLLLRPEIFKKEEDNIKLEDKICDRNFE